MRYPEKRRYGRLYWGTWFVNLGTITNFEESLNRQVSTVSVPSRSSEYTIGLDGGGRTDIELSFAHLDGQDGLTNAAWASRLRLAVDRWQARTDGVVLRIGQMEDREGGEQHHVAITQTPEAATDGKVLYSRYDPYFQFESEYQGYIASLTINLPTSMTDVLQGSLRMTLGSRTIKSSSLQRLRPGIAEATPAMNVNDATIQISFDKGENWRALSCPYGSLTTPEQNVFLDPDDPDDVWDSDNDTMVKSYSITGGFMCPFEQLDITLDAKAFRNRFRELYPDDGAYASNLDSGETGPRPRRTRVRVCGIGRGEYMIAEVRATGSRIRMIGYSTAYLAVMTPLEYAIHIGSFGSGVTMTVSEAVAIIFGMIKDGGSTVFPEERVHVDCRPDLTSPDAGVQLGQDMTVWAALQTLAQMCGSRVFFAQGHAYFVDYNRLYRIDNGGDFHGSADEPGPVTLYGKSELMTEKTPWLERPFPLDIDEDLADRRVDTPSFERSESDIMNNVKVKFTRRTDGTDKEQVTGVVTNEVSVEAFGRCPLSPPVWDLGRILTAGSDTDAVRVAKASLQGRAELYTTVSFTLKDAINTDDGCIIWSPLFPPCSAVTALGSSAEQEYIYPGYVKE